jgi:hypothetical protein
MHGDRGLGSGARTVCSSPARTGYPFGVGVGRGRCSATPMASERTPSSARADRRRSGVGAAWSMPRCRVPTGTRRRSCSRGTTGRVLRPCEAASRRQSRVQLRVPALPISRGRRPARSIQTLSFDAYLKLIEDLFLDGQRLDPRTDGRPAPRADRSRGGREARQPPEGIRFPTASVACVDPGPRPAPSPQSIAVPGGPGLGTAASAGSTSGSPSRRPSARFRWGPCPPSATATRSPSSRPAAASSRWTCSRRCSSSGRR